MNRRTFFAALAGLPLVGRFFAPRQPQGQRFVFNAKTGAKGYVYTAPTLYWTPYQDSDVHYYDTTKGKWVVYKSGEQSLKSAPHD